MELVSLVVY